MSNSRVYQFFRNIVFGQEDGNEQVYIPVPNYGQEREAIPPKDKYRIVYLIFLLQGAVMLLGWNAFITASVFFHESFRGSVYENNFQNCFSFVFLSSNLLFLGVALFTQNWENVSYRTVVAIIFSVLIFLLIAISTQYVEFFGPTLYFYFVVTLFGILGITTAYQQSGIFALASQFPPTYMVSVMSGQGLSGSAVALFQILSALMAPPSNSFDIQTRNDLSYSAFLYFLGAFIISLLSLISYFILINSPFYRYYIEQAQDIAPTHDMNLIKETFNRIRIPAFAVGFIFFVTLSVFPSITASIKSTVKDENKSKFHQDYLFIPLHFLIFNLGDWLGRFLPSIQFFAVTDFVKIARMSIARIIFLPVFLMCNVDVGSRIFPLMVNSDLMYFLILLSFAVSNGYLGTLAMMIAPQVDNVAKDLAGTIMTFCLDFGLVLGSIFSFPVLAISCGCNPIGN